MSTSRQQIQKKFNATNSKKNDLPDLPKSIQQYLQFMDYKIRKQFKSFTILSLCGGAERGNFIVQKCFQRAFASMSLNQKTEYYTKYVDNTASICNKLKKGQQGIDNKVTQSTEMILKVGKGNKAFQETQINIQDYKVRSKNKGIPDIDLRNYILRKSKKKNLYCYALQSTKQSEIETVRFQFLSQQDQQKYLPIIQNLINQGMYESLYNSIFNLMGKNSQLATKQLKLKNSDMLYPPQANRQKKQNNFLEIQSNTLRNSRKPDLNKSIIQDIVKSRQQQQLDQQLTQLIDQQNQQMQRIQLEKKKSIKSPYTPQFKQTKRNIFRIMLPTYNLKQLPKLNHFGSIYQSKLMQMYGYINVRQHSQLKLQLVIGLPAQIVCKAIYNVQLYKYWHPSIDQGQIKLKISSQNSCITYLKTKSYNEWYRQRDYLLLTHMFRMGSCFYIVSKSVQNANFIPFQSITRGKFDYMVWRIEPDDSATLKGQKKCRVIMQMKVDHQGLLNKAHQKQLSLRFLKGFQNMQAYYHQIEHQKKLSDIMGFNWIISDRQVVRNQSEVRQNLNSLRTCDFQNGSQISNEEFNEEDQIFYSIQDLSEEQKQICQEQKHQKSQHEISPDLNQNKSLMKSQLIDNNVQQQQIVTNSEGLIVLPQKYIKKKQKTVPFDFEKIVMKFDYGNIIQKDHWQLEKGGGLKLINQVKINAQNNVLKFIMKTLKKNLFSGKGILNISLPVQIFNVDSNLQRVCVSMSLGPQFLQKVTKTTDKLQRFKRVLGFGLSNSVIYFDVQKPFNPILGETYQGYIRGCPVYAEQISHHPPISSIYFVGRGYKITANLQAKVHVHMNSGDGINQGFYHIIFDDGDQIIFQTPPAQISGLAMGDRRFNFKDKGVYLDLKNRYFCEMKMQGGGGFFSKKKRQFTDQIQGDIVTVKPQFIKKFLATQDDKKPSPTPADIQSKADELSGRWSRQLLINDIPDKMIDQINPLNSNSNYREDLYYRKKNDLSRSQIQKQRLEIIQRGDRKLRQKFHGPAHH